MSVRSFHSVYMAGAVAGAALGCYLVSLRVAAERAALEGVETRIVQTQTDIRMLQTEIGTRGRLDQLEQWNASALSLSAPAANQFLQDSFQLAKLTAPEHRLEVKAPVVFASAPAQQPPAVLGIAGNEGADTAPTPTTQQLVHEASLKIESRDVAAAVTAGPGPVQPKVTVKPITKTRVTAAATVKPSAQMKSATQKAVPKLSIAAARSPKPIKLAQADPLAPLPSGKSHSARSQQFRDNGPTK